MFIKIIQRALLLCAVALGASQSWSSVTITATDWNTDFSAADSSASIVGLKVYDAAGLSRTITRGTLAPSSTFAVVHYVENTNDTTFVGCTFSDGLQLSLAHTGGSVIFDTTASTFAMTAEEAYIVANSTSGTTFNVAPTFTGNGFIDVLASQTWTIGADMTLSVPIRIATGKTLTIATAGFRN